MTMNMNNSLIPMSNSNGDQLGINYVLNSIQHECSDGLDGYSATDLSTKYLKTTDNDITLKTEPSELDISTKFIKSVDTEPIQIQPKLSTSAIEAAKLVKNKNMKSGNKKSFVWKYFAHPKNPDGIEDRSRTECLECKSQLAFNASGTTTTMLNHLKSRHPKIAENEEWRKIKSTSMSTVNYENTTTMNMESSTESMSIDGKNSEVNVLSLFSNQNNSENNYLDRGRLLCLTKVIPHQLMVTSCLPNTTNLNTNMTSFISNNNSHISLVHEETNGNANNSSITYNTSTGTTTTNGCVIGTNSYNNSVHNRSAVKRKRKKPLCIQNANQLSLNGVNGQMYQIKPNKLDKLVKQEPPDLASIQSISAISHNSASINNLLSHSFLTNDSCSIIYNDNNNNNTTSPPSLASKIGISDSDRVIVYWLIKDLRPYSVLEETGMKTLFSTLMPSVSIPSVSNLKNQIMPLIYWSLKTEILNDFFAETGAAFSIELWDIPTTGCMYASVKLNYYSNSDSQLRSKMFTTKEINAKFLCSDLLMSCCNEIGIDFSLIQFLPVVMNNPESMSDELANVGEIEQNKKFIIIPCLMSSLQEVAKVGFQQPEIVKLIEKCRALKELAGAYNLQLDNDSSTGSNIVLTSKYSSEQFDLLYWVFMNLDQIVDKLDCFNCNRFEKNDEIFLRQLTPLLEHIYQTLNVIEQNKLCFSASMIKSIILTMNKSPFQPKDDDHQGVIQFKVAVKERLSKIYPPTGRLHEILWIATVLDPRFKKYQDVEESAMLQELRNQIKNYNEMSSSEFLHETPNSIKREDLHYIFGDDCLSQEPVSEVDQYLNEHKIDIEKNPIKWWQDNASRFPNLSKLALKYLCIPLANQYGLDSLESDSILYSRRKEIDPEDIDHYLFLNHNWR